jgi:hypothetical protein
MNGQAKSREAWHRASAKQKLFAARCVASNFSDDGEWNTVRGLAVCRVVVADVTWPLGRM